MGAPSKSSSTLVSTTECTAAISTPTSDLQLVTMIRTASSSSIDENYDLPCSTTDKSRNDASNNINALNIISNATADMDVNQTVLAAKLVGDVVIAISVTALAAPFLTVIDKALVQRSAAVTATTTTISSSATLTVWSSMRSSFTNMIQQPTKFLKSSTFLWMWGTYAATYTAANTLRTLFNNNNDKSDYHRPSNTSSIPTTKVSTVPPVQVYLSSGTSLLIGTSIVNSTASVLKDRAYAQLYGNNNNNVKTNMGTLSKAAIPRITYALWLIRDLTVIGAAFVLPTHVAQLYQQYQNNNSNNVRRTTYHLSDATTLRIAQVATPVMAQIVAGPLHYIGYDCYNRNVSHLPSIQLKVMDRLRNLQQSLGQVITARMIRIIPGYGIAGVLNTELLQQWKQTIVLPLSNQLRSRTSCSSDSKTFHVGSWNYHHHQKC